MGLINHMGDVNLGIHNFAELAARNFVLELKDGRMRYSLLLSSQNIFHRGIGPRDL